MMSKTNAVTSKITLTEKEKELFALLMSVAHEGFVKVPVLRVAGGWVRDKLLGRLSDDIGIAIDTLTGKQFTDVLKDYLLKKKGITQKVAIIKSNPEQSKHLETATVNLLGIGIDFVNLRSETYSEGSRIPTMIFGTPLEDANRRDLTINALFYNINTSQVEDFTKMGIKDLQEGIIRTPLEPLETFTDDPLRVLRSIRFSARYSFKIYKTLVDAASESRVTEELKKKISRERIGKELMLMLGTRRFSYAMECIYQVNLWDAVFKFPDDISEAFEWDPLQSLSCLTNLERVLALRTGYFGGISDCGISCAEVPRPTQCALLAALFVPIAECQFLTPKRKFESLVSFIMLSSIKFTSKDTATVTAFLSHRPKFVALIADRSAWTRRTAGRLIHDAGEHWRDVFYLALASVLPPIPLKKSLSPERPTLELNAEGKRLLECYDAFAKYVDDEALGNAWSLKTLFNGKQVASMLSTRTGPWVTCALSKLLEWQFDNPAATADEARAWVVENKEMLTIPPTPTTPASPSSSVPSSPTS